MSADIHVLRDVPEAEPDVPSEEQLVRFARHALGATQGELNLRIVNGIESQRLNAQFRGRHKPTNVLSFPAEVPDGFPVELIGDLALCASVIRREAEEQHKAMDAHWAHMVIHGCLHLCGYDHETDGEAEVMEAREIALLAELGFANPYLTKEERENS